MNCGLSTELELSSLGIVSWRRAAALPYPTRIRVQSSLVGFGKTACLLDGYDQCGCLPKGNLEDRREI